MLLVDIFVFVWCTFLVSHSLFYSSFICLTEMCTKQNTNESVVFCNFSFYVYYVLRYRSAWKVSNALENSGWLLWIFMCICLSVRISRGKRIVLSYGFSSNSHRLHASFQIYKKKMILDGLFCTHTHNLHSFRLIHSLKSATIILLQTRDQDENRFYICFTITKEYGRISVMWVCVCVWVYIIQFYTVQYNINGIKPQRIHNAFHYTHIFGLKNDRFCILTQYTILRNKRWWVVYVCIIWLWWCVYKYYSGILRRRMRKTSTFYSQKARRVRVSI